MKYIATFLCAMLALGAGFGLFHIKYLVSNLEGQHGQLHQSIEQTEESIHVLKAEWAHLNDPRELQRLAKKYLKAGPVSASHLVSVRRALSSGGKSSQYDHSALDQLVASVSHQEKGGA